jgi:hypothetical protein
MSSAANSQTYGPTGGPTGGPPWGQGPAWGPSPWQHAWHWGPPWTWHRLPRPVAVALTVLGFIAWWPIGLALLFYNIGSGSMGCRAYRQRAAEAAAQWQGRGGNSPASGQGYGPWANGGWTGWRNWCGGGGERPAPTSGNRAFDEYRTETLRRLEEEQKDFASFLERLRFAKDKSEFDQFMTERRQPPANPEPTEPPAG